jgi:outer membrane protein assembly factor BamB
MTKIDSAKLAPVLPAAAALLAIAALALWLAHRPNRNLTPRMPGADNAETSESTGGSNPVLAGKLIPGPGQPASLPGAWPRFRGANWDGISAETTSLARTWGAGGPAKIWSADLGEGYAGPAVFDGRVYVMDYDQKKRQDALRCLSLADGKEIWRFTYPVKVLRYHGMSRTVPTVTDKYVVAMGPKCHVSCVDAQTGELRWGLDLVLEFGAVVPNWYAGQCPFVEDGKVILAVGSTNILLIAVELASGKVLWQTPNPNQWQMTHSSIMPMTFKGRRQYLYCASQGVVGVAAADGALLWDTPDWKITFANVPSPVVLEEGKIFFSGGYGAGSLMAQLVQEGDRIKPKILFRLDPKTFGATQHTPIYYQGRLYGVRQDEQFVCLDPAGQVLWTSGPKVKFGLGPFLLAGGLIYALSDTGQLRLIEATPEKFNLLAEAKVLEGREAWAPLALAGGRLLARDVHRMVCLEVGVK